MRLTCRVPENALGLQAGPGPPEKEPEMLAPPLVIVPEPVKLSGQGAVWVNVSVTTEPLIVPLRVPVAGSLPAGELHVPVIAAPVCTNWNATGPLRAPPLSVFAPLTVPA